MKRILSLALVVCAGVYAQNAAPLQSPAVQFLDNNGAPLSGGYLRTCTSGSACSALHPWSAPSTPLASYTDSTAGVANTNPIVLDSAGRGNVWLSGSAYKLVLTDASGVVIWTQDNVTSLQALKTNGVNFLSYTASGTGAVVRTVAAKLGDVVTFADFGAVGDGSTNDSTKIQTALNSGAAVIDGGGKTYLVSGNLAIGSNTTLQNFALKLVGGSAIPLSGLTIDGTSSAKSAITIHNVRIDGTRAAMTNFGAPANGDKSCFRLVGTVRDVLFDGVTGNFCGTDGLEIFSYARPATDNDSDLRFHNITVRNSTFKYNRRSGISLDSAYNITFENVVSEYNNLDMAEIQTLYTATPNMTDLLDWQSGTYTPTGSCTSANTDGACADRLGTGALYGVGIDVEGYGVGSGINGLTIVGGSWLHNANGGVVLIDVTAQASTGYLPRQAVRIIGAAIDQGLHPSSHTAFPFSVYITGPYSSPSNNISYKDVTITGNTLAGPVQMYSTSGGAIVGNRISDPTAAGYAVRNGGCTNLEVIGNESDGATLRYADTTGTVQQERFEKQATADAQSSSYFNYTIGLGPIANPLGIGSFPSYYAIQNFGLPLALNPSGSISDPILIATSTAQTNISSKHLQVGGGIAIQADKSGVLTLGRYSGANQYAQFQAQDDDGTVPIGYSFGFGGAASVFRIFPNTIFHSGLKSTTGTRFICVDTAGNFISSATACSGT